jgi:hypothetical protein
MGFLLPDCEIMLANAQKFASACWPAAMTLKTRHGVSFAAAAFWFS